MNIQTIFSHFCFINHFWAIPTHLNNCSNVQMTRIYKRSLDDREYSFMRAVALSTRFWASIPLFCRLGVLFSLVLHILDYGNFNARAFILPLAKPRFFGKRQAADVAAEGLGADARLFKRPFQVFRHVQRVQIKPTQARNTG